MGDAQTGSPTPPLEVAKLNISHLTKPIKFRIIDELKTVFRDHPVYHDIDNFIQNKYALDERPVHGIVLKNASGDLIKLSPDNFIGTLISHVFLGRVSNYKGRSIEWVREDVENILGSSIEDVSDQFDGTIRIFTVTNTPLVDPLTGEIASRPLSVRVTVNGVPVIPAAINAQDGQITLQVSPSATDVVNVQYCYRTLEPQGIYYVEITGKNSFIVDPLYVIENEVITNNYDGVSSNLQLDHYPLLGQTLEIWRDRRIKLYPNDEFTVDATTGIVTLNITLPAGTILTASYKYPGTSRGPYPLIQERSNNQAIKGVVLAFERGILEGDKQAIIIRNSREQVAKVYGGKWDLSFPIDVYSRDPIEREELADLLVASLWEGLKPRLDQEGIVVKNVSLGGESEELYSDTTGDYYFIASIDLSVEVDWELHRPLPFAFTDFDFVLGGADQVKALGGEEQFSIQMENVLPDLSPVARIGFRNFERLSS